MLSLLSICRAFADLSLNAPTGFHWSNTWLAAVCGGGDCREARRERVDQPEGTYGAQEVSHKAVSGSCWTSDAETRISQAAAEPPTKNLWIVQSFVHLHGSYGRRESEVSSRSDCSCLGLSVTRFIRLVSRSIEGPTSSGATT